ncbi:MAG TPA: hypothetical protein VGD31_15485 [Sphingobacteriaceae bacterium]
MEPDYLSILYQWLLFFALVGLVFFPAFRFKKIASLNGKKGWLFFIIGAVIGFVIVQINGLLGLYLSQLQILSKVRGYLWISYLVIGYALVFLAIYAFRQWMKKPQNQMDADVLDGEMISRSDREG